MGQIEELAARVADLEQRLEAERAQVFAMTNTKLYAAEQAAEYAQREAWSACRAWVESILDGRTRAVPPADKLGARLFRLAELEDRDRLARERALEDDDLPVRTGGQ